LGIASDEPDYKLCWLINQQLGTSFIKGDDLVVFNSKINQQQEVSLFAYYDENKMVTYRLISNRPSSGYFLSDLKNIDYVLHIQGDVVTNEIDELIGSIIKTEGIRLCVPVDLRRIKEKERLHLW
ncbi:MAG: IPExxxVDY family protein, partial [Bacteroidales bacterium]